MTNVMPRAAHRPSRRSVLLDAALTELAEGYEAASIVKIAGVAGMTPAAVYYHFSSRDELFEALLDRVVGDLADLLSRTEGEATLEEWIDGTVLRVGQWMRDKPLEARFLFVTENIVGYTGHGAELRGLQRLIRGMSRTVRDLAPETSRLQASMRVSAVLALFGELARVALDNRTEVPRHFTVLVRAARGVAQRVFDDA